MKRFRISFTICEGGNEYADEITLRRGRQLTDRQAASLIWELFTVDPDDTDEQNAFADELIKEGFAMISGDCRGIKDLSIEELRPVIVIVEGGRVLSIDNIPRDIVIEVRDFDVDDPAAPRVRKSKESGALYLESVWVDR